MKMITIFKTYILPKMYFISQMKGKDFKNLEFRNIYIHTSTHDFPIRKIVGNINVIIKEIHFISEVPISNKKTNKYMFIQKVLI